MKKSRSHPARRQPGLSLCLSCWIVAALLPAGCRFAPMLPNAVQDLGPRYTPSNIYRRTNSLPPQIRRVAVLPLITPGSTVFLDAGAEAMTPLLFAELEKCKRFEVIPVSPADLRQWTGKAGWRADEPLPSDFFARVSDATGCDAILFCLLTRYEPYQPLAVGWKFSLVANPPGPASTQEIRDKILWCADEVIDAGEPGVANAARDYYGRHLRDEAPSADSSTILSSPARFGQYSLAALLETLPERSPAASANSAKVIRKAGR